MDSFRVMNSSTSPSCHVGDAVLLARQGEGGQLFRTQTNQVFLAGQAAGGLHVFQLLGADLLLHIPHIGVGALELGVVFIGAGAGGVACQAVELGPVGGGKQLVKYLLALDGGLGGLVVLQPAVEPVQPDEYAYKEY